MLVDPSKPCTQIYLQIIINCINLQLAIRISRNHSFQTWITKFSRSKPILRLIGSVDLLEPRSKVISTEDGHVRNVSRNLQSDVIYNTKCTRGDARSFFCTYKTYLCANSSRKRVYHVNVSNDNFVCLKLAPRIRCKTWLDSCENRYYTNNTQGSHSFTKHSYKVCIAHCFSYIARQSILNCE